MLRDQIADSAAWLPEEHEGVPLLHRIADIGHGLYLPHLVVQLDEIT